MSNGRISLEQISVIVTDKIAIACLHEVEEFQDMQS